MSRPLLLAIAAVAALLYGCANFNTIGRSTSLPDNGKAIHLDAPQRLVFTNSAGDTCAEPSPDALQAYAASFTAHAKTPSGVDADLASAFAESSGSIGLRTQSITLMRDALYRVCEAHHNGAIGSQDTVLLLERSQDLTLGILAIEQLTGAVVARQTTLSAGPNATAAKNANETNAALAPAQKDEATKKDALTKATDAQTKQKALVETDTKAATDSAAKAKPVQSKITALTTTIAQAEKTLASETSQSAAAEKAAEDDAAQVTALQTQLDQLTKATPQDPAAIQKAQTALTSAQTDAKDAASKAATLKSEVAQQTTALAKSKVDLADAQKDATVVQATKDAATLKEAEATLTKDNDTVTADQSAYDAAQKVTAAVRANVNAAAKAAQDVADGSGSFSTGTDRDNINPQTVAQIATATTTIVNNVLNKGHLTDACINLLTAFSLNQLSKPDDARVQRTLDLCASVIDTDLKSPGHPEAVE